MNSASSERTCAQCGRAWDVTGDDPYPAWCSVECIDMWMDAHPDEKEELGWITMQDLVDRVFKRCGLIPPSRRTVPLARN